MASPVTPSSEVLLLSDSRQVTNELASPVFQKALELLTVLPILTTFSFVVCVHFHPLFVCVIGLVVRKIMIALLFRLFWDFTQNYIMQEHPWCP